MTTHKVTSITATCQQLDTVHYQWGGLKINGRPIGGDPATCMFEADSKLYVISADGSVQSYGIGSMITLSRMSADDYDQAHRVADPNADWLDY